MKHLLTFFIGTLFLVNPSFAELITKEPIPDSVCITGTAEFSVIVMPSTSLQWQFSTNPDVGSWSDATVGVSGAQTTTLQVTLPGMYSGNYFRVVVMDSNGVEPNDTSLSVSLTVFQNPIVDMVSVPGGFAFCEDGSIVLQTMDMNSLNSYIWGPMGQTLPTINVMTGGMYSVTVTDVNGCIGSSANEVMEYPAPTPLILPNVPQVKFCPGKSVQLMSDSIYTEYNWSSPPGGTEGSITVNVVGNYILTVTDSHGCTSNTSRIVDTFPSAVKPIIGPTPKEFCHGDSLLLMGNSGYIDYMWSTGGNKASLLIFSKGTYTLTVKDVNGCTATETADVIENPNPIAIFITFPDTLSSSLVKVGDEITFRDSSSTSGSPIDTWTWNFGENADMQYKTYEDPYIATNIRYSEVGLKTACLEAIDKKVCADDTCINFQVYPAMGPSVISFLESTPDCLNDTFCITTIVLVGGGTEYKLRSFLDWDFNPGLLEFVSNEYIEVTDNTIRASTCFVFISQGKATITFNALQIDKNDPTDTIPGSGSTMVESGNLVPTYTVVQKPAFLCQGEIGTISLKVTPDEDGKIEYSQNGITISLPFTNGNISIPVNDTNNPGIIEIIIQRIYIGDCRSELGDTINIEVRRLPEVMITGPDLVCVNELAYLLAHDAERYEWKINSNPLPSDTIGTLIIKSDIPGSYNYTVTGNLDGCFDSDTFLLLVSEPLTPEIFGDSVVCINQIVEYSSHDPLITHIWTVSGGSAISQDLDSINIQWQTTGQWPLVLTQNIGKCTGADTVSITVSDDNSPPFNSLVWLKGGGILLYPNPDTIHDLCYQWYFKGDSLPGEKYQGYVVPPGVNDSELINYSVKVWYCADGDVCAQSIVYRSTGAPPEEAEPRFQVVPNPNSGTFDVQYDGLTPGHYIQHIISTSGRILYEQELDIAISSGTQPVSDRNLSAAVYFVRWVNTTTGSVLITQIVVLP